MNLRRQHKAMRFTGNIVKKILILLIFIIFSYLNCFAAEEYSPFQPSAKCLDEKSCPRLQAMYEKAVNDGERNFVLNHLQAGLAAFQLKEYDLSIQSFDQALLRIESVFSNDERAAKARSLWYEEGAKDFKGEPYERCMAYYYRGLLYMLKGDYENARASFKSGILQDAYAEDEQNQSDFTLLIFLGGLASQYLGDTRMAIEAYEEVKKLRPDFVQPKADDNVLIIVETGKSPRKVGDGIGHYELKYRRGRNFTEKRAQLKVGEVVQPLYPMEDIFWQAATRGGRLIDKIIKGKVHFQETQKASGEFLSNVATAGLMASSLPLGEASSKIQGASAALGLIGVIQMAIAINVNTKADIRYWNNLPDTVHIFTMKHDPASPVKPVSAEYLDEQGKTVALSTSEIILEKSGVDKYIGWTRSRSALGD